MKVITNTQKHFVSSCYKILLLVIISIFPSQVLAAVDSCPGNTLSSLNNATADASQTVSVTLPAYTTYYYSFTPNVNGKIQVSSNANKSYNSLFIKDGCGSNLWSATYDSTSKSSSSINVTSGQTIVIAFERRWSSDIDVTLRFDFSATLPVGCDNSLDTGDQNAPGTIISDLDGATASVTDCISGTSVNGDDEYYYFTVQTSGTLDITTSSPNNHDYRLGIGSSSGGDEYYTYGAVTTQSHNVPQITLNAGDGVYIHVRESGSDDDDWELNLNFTQLPATAVADTYNVNINTTLNANVFDNDSGPGIQIVGSDTSSLVGTIDSYDANTGAFTYTPPNNWEGTTTLTYTIRDSNGVEDTATVTFNVARATTYSSGGSFKLVNPEETRNIRGNYLIAGNTMLVMTNNQNNWGGTHIDDQTKTNNSYMTEYIDIDSDPGTWNSSSSYVTIPANYEQDNGQGILWAGLFWMGNISSEEGANNSLRMGVANGSSSFTLQDRDNVNINLQSLAANRIKFKVDQGAYNDVQAIEMFASGSSTSAVRYSTYADVTQILQSANLSSGQHTFTAANLTHTEGREDASSGNFGGWSLVIIYKEDFNGKPRNISVYAGLEEVGSGNTPPPIQISGFRLPASGAVSAKLSVFAGEGEYLYGPPWGRGELDTMKLSIDGSGSGTDSMPGAIDPNNIFDGKMTNIFRDATIPDNALTGNTVGVEVDDYDVSTIMTNYRSINPNLSSSYIHLRSTQDLIFPAMIVFSAELYQPTVCYDYTYDFDGYVIPSINSDLNTTFQNLGVPLGTHLTVRSTEGDFDLTNFKVTVSTDESYLTYVHNTAGYAGNSINVYNTMTPPELNVSSPSTFSMNIGSGAGINGGTVHPFETHYMRFKHDLNASQSDFNTRVNVTVDFTTDYGSGPVPIHRNLTSDDRCTGYTAYRPEWGIFNVIDGNAANINTYNLKTQAVQRPFSAQLVGYGQDASGNYTVAQNFNTDVEVEVFNVGIYGTDTNVSCNNPDSNISTPTFVRLNNSSSASIPNLNYDRANQNTGFRMWYLEDENGALVSHQSGSSVPGADEAYFDGLYATEYPNDNNCSTECSNTANGCYACLKKWYGKPLCSRDNFSIRPADFYLKFSDKHEWDDTSGSNTVPNNTPQVGLLDSDSGGSQRVVAGYKYQIEALATNYGSNTAAKGYTHDPFRQEGFQATANGNFAVDPIRNHLASMINDMGSNPNCNDISNETFKYQFWNGQDINNSIVVRNVGNYHFHILDTNWTYVDNPGNFGQDCIADSNLTQATGDLGCNFASRDISFVSFPHHFDVSGVSYTIPTATLTSTWENHYLYTNNLADDNNSATNPNANHTMALRLFGPIQARGKDGAPLTNFVDQCAAQPIEVNLVYNDDDPARDLIWREANASTVADPNIVNPTNNPLSGARLTDANGNLVTYNPAVSTGPNDVGLIRGSAGTMQALTGNPAYVSGIGLSTENFLRGNGGSTTLNLYLSYGRDVNAPHDPITFNFNSFNIDCYDSDGVSNNGQDNDCQAVAENTTTYSPALAKSLMLPGNALLGSVGVGTMDINQTTTFFYARANTPRHRIQGNIGNVTTYYEVYCDTTAGCSPAELALVSNAANPNGRLSVDDIRWYQNLNHIQVAGMVFQGLIPGTLTPWTTTNISARFNDFTQLGTNVNNNAITTSTYSYGGNNYPYKATINYSPNGWLVYDRFDPNQTVNRFEIEFQNPGAGWQGVGDSGTKSNSNASGNSNRRMQW